MEASDLKIEIIFDISFLAGFLIADEKITIIDSRELKDYVLNLSEEFQYSNEDDYLDEIEDFAFMKLMEKYGQE